MSAVASPGIIAGQNWATPANAQGLAYFKAIAAAKPTGNVLTAPHVVGKVAAMVAAGAKGRTKTQFDAILRDDGTRAAGISAYESSLQGIPGTDIRVATGAYVQDGFNIDTNYLNKLTGHFGAIAKNANFAADPDGERVQINRDVAEATNQMVPNLFPEGTIEPSTVLVLTAAFYGKFPWAIQFDKAKTREGAFLLAGTGPEASAATKLMHQPAQEVVDPQKPWEVSERKYAYLDAGDAQILELPFKERFSAVMVLPKGAAGIQSFEAGLTEEKIAGWLKELDGQRAQKWRQQLVNVTLPQVNAKEGGIRNEVLKALGVTDAFGSEADLTGIAQSGGHLVLGAFVDGNALKWDEEGAEVAAAAGAGVIEESAFVPPVYDFVADRPFLVFIRDNDTGVIQMMGRIGDPGKIEEETAGENPAPDVAIPVGSPKPAGDATSAAAQSLARVREILGVIPHLNKDDRLTNPKLERLVRADIVSTFAALSAKRQRHDAITPEDEAVGMKVQENVGALVLAVIQRMSGYYQVENWDLLIGMYQSAAKMLGDRESDAGNKAAIQFAYLYLEDLTERMKSAAV